MPITRQQVIALLLSPESGEIEKAIAHRTRRELDRENISVHCGFALRDIEYAGLTEEDIAERLGTDADQIVRFAVACMGEPKSADDEGVYPAGEEPDARDLPETLGAPRLPYGFAIMYLLFVYFLRERPHEEFVDYLKRRRIPAAATYAHDLRRIYVSLT